MRITSEPFLINFHPYSKEEIADILKFRLYSVKNNTYKIYFLQKKKGRRKKVNVLQFTDVIESSAISLCAGKVSAIDGDVRKALAICKLAIDKVEQREITEESTENPTKKVFPYLLMEKYFAQIVELNLWTLQKS